MMIKLGHALVANAAVLGARGPVKTRIHKRSTREHRRGANRRTQSRWVSLLGNVAGAALAPAKVNVVIILESGKVLANGVCQG